MRPLYFSIVFSCFSLLSFSQNPNSLPGPITVCPAGEYAGHHHTPSPLWLKDKMSEAKDNENECATINVNYIGFTPEAEAAFQAAVDIWEAALQTNVDIEVEANWTTLDEGVLGSAGPNTIWTDFSGAPEDHFYPSALADQLHGNDLDPGEPDIVTNFNSEFDWYLGTDGNPPGDQFDLLSVVLHELGHGLGFISTKDYDDGEGSLGFGGTPYTYDTFLTLGASGDELLNIFNPFDLGDALTSENVFSNSPSATFALGGVSPQHFAPIDYAPGSSISHWDESAFPAGDINSLMSPQIGPGEGILDPGPITLGLFEDIGWVLCANVVVTCEAEDLVLDGEAEICPDETTTVDVAEPNIIPENGGVGVRFNNGIDVDIYLTNVTFPYSFNNDLNGVLSANDFDPFLGVFELSTFVYTDPNDAIASICNESVNPVTVTFFSEDDAACNVSACLAQDLFLDGPPAICPDETTAVDINLPNQIPAGGGEGIRFTNGTDVNIVLSGITFPYTFDNDLNGLLSANDFDLFIGDFELQTFVYTDDNDVSNSICDESLEAVSVTFYGEDDPACNEITCLAQDPALLGQDEICPGETTTIDLEAPNEIPVGGGQGLRFNNGNDVDLILSEVSFPYSFDNDLNGVLSSNGFDPFEGSFEVTVVTYTDENDAPGSICSEASNAETVSFLTILDAPCAPEPCLDWQQPEPGVGWSNFNDLFGGAPCDPGTGCPVFEITEFEAWAGEAYAIDNLVAGGIYTFSICDGPGSGSWVPEFTILSPEGNVDAFGPGDGCAITWTASESGTYLVVINEQGSCGEANQINNGYPSITCEGDEVSCPIECSAGELAPADEAAVCFGLSASILNTEGLDGISFPEEGGYHLKVEINGATYFVETEDPQFGFELNNDLFGVVSSQNDDLLVGIAQLTAETYEDSNYPEGTICSSSNVLSFEFYAEGDENCTTGVTDFTGPNGWKFFPNPASDNASIQFVSTKEGILNIAIVDTQGRTIHSQRKPVSTGSVNFDLNVGHIAPGYYNLVLSMDLASDSKPIVISR